MAELAVAPIAPADTGGFSTSLMRLAGSPRLILTLTCLLLLLPFLSKPLHIDDPMYVWAAENILTHPLDPYGFAVNWRSTLTPMADVMQNPPLVCYYLASAMIILGRSEPALHLAMVLPAIGAILGTYEIAKEMGARPMLASVSTLVTPVFLLSATTIMSDMTMVCAYVWAIWFWVRGIKTDSVGMLWLAALLVAASTLTKYFGITLFPLLIVYGFMVKRRAGVWLLPLLLPVAIVTAYHFWTKGLYGQGLLVDAAGYATQQRWASGGKMIASVLSGLAFAGGCCAAITFLMGVAAPGAMSRWVIAAAAVIAILLLALDPITGHSIRQEGAVRWLLLVQLLFWSSCGFAMVAASLRYLWNAWTADHVLLACWILGTLAFAAFVNWKIAGRSILPMVPAAAIVAAMVCARRPQAAWRSWSALGAGAVLAILVTAADTSLARTQRDAATQINEGLESPAGAVYFSGHWGFQHYMERQGARPLDKNRTKLEPGDVVILPDNTSLPIGLPSSAGRVAATLEFAPMEYLSTMRQEMHAGFYSDMWGPLPFALGRVPAERYQIVIIQVPLASNPSP